MILFKIYKRYSFVLFVILYLTSCSSTIEKPIIKFSADSTSIIINNIDEVSFLQVKKLYLANPDSVKFISVINISTDADSVQFENKVPGKITFNNKDVVFSPYTPFAIGKTYLIESFIGAQFSSIKKIFNNDVKSNLAPQEQILTH